jgi:DNA polymerase-3 subunit epsilon
MYFSVDSIDFGAYMVHGLSPSLLEELSGGLIFKDRIAEIEKDFSCADLIVAHNTAFDFMFLRKEFENCNKDFIVKNEFCSMKKMTPVCKIKRSSGKGYKYPKLSELCGYFYLSDEEILEQAENLFGETKGYHDARFDTTAVYLAVNRGMQTEELMRELKEYL